MTEKTGGPGVRESQTHETTRPNVALRALVASTLVLAVVDPGTARAFPGLYVGKGGSERPPRSDRSSLVVMRDGEHIVVSIHSDYVGPREDFGWVLPVPATIQAKDVRTLRNDALERIERLSSARLVEYWEQDPCAPTHPAGQRKSVNTAAPAATPEARFASSGYDVSILDGGDASALRKWLAKHGLPMPAGLEASMGDFAKPGYSLVVTRVDASGLSFEGRRAVLPPIRLAYRSDRLVLPMAPSRIGADGVENLVLHVLAPQRSVVTSRRNVLVPTNLAMYRAARGRFNEVYAEILQRVWERTPRAVITEYAWPATDCEACPSPPLGSTDLDTFGLDVIGGPGGESAERFVLTKLRMRLDVADTTDLVFGEGPPIAGGRGRPKGVKDLDVRIDRRPKANAFQARYSILNKWKGEVACPSPQPGRWGPPPGRRRPAAIAARPGLETIVKGRLRRFVRTWTRVLRIPATADAKSAYDPDSPVTPRKAR